MEIERNLVLFTGEEEEKKNSALPDLNQQPEGIRSCYELQPSAYYQLC
jgi:hypothetical protein